MSEYQLEVKQIVDYPRCRVYREFVQSLMPKMEHCVVCFSHVYNRDLPERRIRDYDNLELKQYLDVAASFILTDDNGLLCDAYNTTEFGDQDCTRILIMDSKRFPDWLDARHNALKSITDL